MIQIEFEHKPAAHCENGVIANILRFYGFDIPEPLVFGLSSGLFFAHMPFLKLWGLAFTTFRTRPGVFFARVSKLLGLKVKVRRNFLNPERAMQKLDEVIHTGTPVGCVVGIYYLPYMPLAYRFHFNGHNLCVIGKDDQDNYLVSDTNAIEKVTISRKDLARVRFAKGASFPLYGQMYWVESVPDKLPDLAPLVRKAIKKNCWSMTSQPKWIPYFGVNGIYYLSKRIRTWEKKMGKHKTNLNLAEIIRMLEEIGTGGAGFRYIYAAFLQQAATITGIESLNDFSLRLSEIGDLWRDFAYKTARVLKQRQGEQYSYDELGDLLFRIAQMEEAFFKELKGVV
jgi:hypothetical protein